MGGLLAQTGVVLAHYFTGTDAVDGFEIRWEDETQYDTAREHAQDEWHSLRGDDDCVEILEDEWNTISDLEWLDIDDDSVIWAGKYFQVWGADHIKLNEYYMDQYGDCAKKNVTMHEMGHALGLEHWVPPTPT